MVRLGFCVYFVDLFLEENVNVKEEFKKKKQNHTPWKHGGV